MGFTRLIKQSQAWCLEHKLNLIEHMREDEMENSFMCFGNREPGQRQERQVCSVSLHFAAP